MGELSLGSRDMIIVSTHLKIVQWDAYDEHALSKIERFISDETGQNFGGTNEIKDQFGFHRLRNNSSNRDWANWLLRYGSHLCKRDLEQIVYSPGNGHNYWGAYPNG